MGMSVEDLIKRSKIGQDHARTVTFLPEPEPRDRWATIFSVDDHVVEPPDIFEGRFSAQFAADAPRVIETDEGGQFLFESLPAGSVALVARWEDLEVAENVELSSGQTASRTLQLPPGGWIVVTVPTR